MSAVGDTRKVNTSFDHHSSDIAVDPYPHYKSMRDQCPIVWSDAYQGFWVFLGYQAVWNASRDDATFLSSPPGVGIPDYPIRPQIPLETDAPMTQKLRAILHHHFSPAAVQRLEPTIRELANELVDAFVAKGECDFIVDFAQPLPARTVLRMLGYEEHRWAEFPDGAFTAAFALYEEIKGNIAKRKEEGLGDDLVSVLLTATLDGEPLDEEIAIDYILLLLFGGLDTTTSALGNALVRIQAHPEIRDQLLADASLLDDGIEEFLRLDSPVQALARTLAHDTEMCGQHLKQGDRALLVWAAADRDPEQFPEPDELRLDRTGNRHVAFGVGLHRCLGSNLGRTMFRIMLETVLERLPDYELTDDPAQYRFADASSVYGLHHLPARFSPQAPRHTASL
jgi:cytochrome P450